MSSPQCKILSDDYDNFSVLRKVQLWFLNFLHDQIFYGCVRSWFALSYTLAHQTTIKASLVNASVAVDHLQLRVLWCSIMALRSSLLQQGSHHRLQMLQLSCELSGILAQCWMFVFIISSKLCHFSTKDASQELRSTPCCGFIPLKSRKLLEINGTINEWRSCALWMSHCFGGRRRRPTVEGFCDSRSLTPSSSLLQW